MTVITHQLFDVSELQVSYTCPECSMAFLFDRTEPAKTWTRCPKCATELQVEDGDKSFPPGALWKVLSAYWDLVELVAKYHQLPVKFAVTIPKSFPFPCTSSQQARIRELLEVLRYTDKDIAQFNTADSAIDHLEGELEERSIQEGLREQEAGLID